MRLGLGIDLTARRGGGIPFGSDLKYNFYERAYAEFLEKKETENVKVLPSCGLVDANNYLLKSIVDYEASETTGFVEIDFYHDGGSTPYQFFASGDESTSTRYFDFQLVNGAPRLIFRNGTLGFNNIISTGVAVSVGRHTVRYGNDLEPNKYYIQVDGVSKTLIESSGLNDGKWMDLITGRDNLTVGILKNSSVITSAQFKIFSINHSNKHKWYFTGKGKYEYDTVGSVNLTWTGTSHISYDENASRYYLDNGWYLYKKTGEVDEQVPISSTVTDITALGYSKPEYGSYSSSVKEVNMANCYIDLSATDNPVFDRSNETTNSALSRSSAYYNISHPYWWHISEISDPRNYMQFLNAGYAGMFYGGITTYLSSGEYFIKMLNFMLLYGIDKIGDDQYKIMKYCGTNVFADI